MSCTQSDSSNSLFSTPLFDHRFFIIFSMRSLFSTTKQSSKPVHPVDIPSHLIFPSVHIFHFLPSPDYRLRFCQLPVSFPISKMRSCVFILICHQLHPPLHYHHLRAPLLILRLTGSCFTSLSICPHVHFRCNKAWSPISLTSLEVFHCLVLHVNYITLTFHPDR